MWLCRSHVCEVADEVELLWRFLNPSQPKLFEGRWYWDYKLDPGIQRLTSWVCFNSGCRPETDLLVTGDICLAAYTTHQTIPQDDILPDDDILPGRTSYQMMIWLHVLTLMPNTPLAYKYIATLLPLLYIPTIPYFRISPVFLFNPLHLNGIPCWRFSKNWSWGDAQAHRWCLLTRVSCNPSCLSSHHSDFLFSLSRMRWL